MTTEGNITGESGEEFKALLNMFSIATAHGDVDDLGELDLNRLICAGLIKLAVGPQAYQLTEAGQNMLQEKIVRGNNKG